MVMHNVIVMVRHVHTSCHLSTGSHQRTCQVLTLLYSYCGGFRHAFRGGAALGRRHGSYKAEDRKTDEVEEEQEEEDEEATQEQKEVNKQDDKEEEKKSRGDRSWDQRKLLVTREREEPEDEEGVEEEGGARGREC